MQRGIHLLPNAGVVEILQKVLALDGGGLHIDLKDFVLSDEVDSHIVHLTLNARLIHINK